MELIYTVSSPFKRDWFLEKKVSLVSLSSKNVLAFSTTLDIQKKKSKNHKGVMDSTYYIYICDIDKPWQIHKLTSSHKNIVALEWHPSGSKIFFADDSGECFVFQMMNFFLNSWKKLASCNFDKCNIIKATWLTQGEKVSFSVDKKDSPMYADKFQLLSHYCPITCYGSQLLEGIFLVTANEFILLLVPEDGSTTEMTYVKSEMSITERSIAVSDVQISDDKILVVTNDGLCSSVVRCHHVYISNEDDKIKLDCQFAKSFQCSKQNASSTPGMNNYPADHNEGNIKFLKFFSSDSILVSYNLGCSSHVELWQLGQEKVGIVHSTVTKKWTRVASLSHNSHVTSIAVPQLPVIQQAQQQQQHQEMSFENPQFSDSFIQYIAVAYKDGSAKLVNRSTFVLMATTHLDTGIIDEKWECPEKKAKHITPYMYHMQQSFTGCILIGIDQNSCVYVMKAINTRDPVTQVSTSVLVSLHEYLVITSRDYWDVLAAVKPGTAEAVLQKLNDNFKRQPLATQEMNLGRMMHLTGLLLRSLNNSSTATKCGEHYCKSLLHLISAHLKTLFSPKSSGTTDSGIGERFSQICKSCDSPDLDSLVMTLSSDKRFFIDATVTNRFQVIFEWILNLAVYLVCVALPSSTPLMRTSHLYTLPQIGCSLLKDVGVMATVRELIVLIKLWCNLRLPYLRDFLLMQTNSNAPSMAGSDKLSLLFRLITRIYLDARDSKDPDESQLEECINFVGQNPKFHPFPYEGFDTPILFGLSSQDTSFMFLQSLPLSFTFLQIPHFEKGKSQIVRKRLRLDGVRLFYIGEQQERRICSRCGSSSLLKDETARPASLVAWDAKFEDSCFCGGMWRLFIDECA